MIYLHIKYSPHTKTNNNKKYGDVSKIQVLVVMYIRKSHGYLPKTANKKLLVKILVHH